MVSLVAVKCPPTCLRMRYDDFNEILFPLHLDRHMEKENYELLTSLHNKIREMLNTFAKEIPIPVLTVDEFLAKITICEN